MISFFDNHEPENKSQTDHLKVAMLATWTDTLKIIVSFDFYLSSNFAFLNILRSNLSRKVVSVTHSFYQLYIRVVS